MTRADYGTGTWQRRGKSWVHRFMVEGWGQRSVSGKTKAICQRRRKEVEAALLAGVDPRTARMTVRELIAQWLPVVKATRVHGTYGQYEQISRLYIAPLWGQYQLRTLRNRGIFAKGFETMVLNGVSPNRIAYTRTVLSALFTYAIEQNMLQQNPVEHVKAGAVAHSEIQPLTPDEARRFYAACGSHPLGVVFILTIACGMRQGEVLGLTVDDINDGTGTVTLRHNLQFEDGKHVLRHTKGKRERTVTLPRFALDVLRARREVLRAGECDREGWGLLFFMPESRAPIHSTTIRKLLYRLLKDAGLPRQKFHNLRHCAASLLAYQGASVHEIQRLLGHSTPTITANVYTHLLQPTSRVAGMMDDVFQRNGEDVGRTSR